MIHVGGDAKRYFTVSMYGEEKESKFSYDTSTNNLMAANSSVPMTGESYTSSKVVYKTQLKQSKKVVVLDLVDEGDDRCEGWTR